MWRVRSSRIVHADRWVCLRADDCVSPDGVDINPYYVFDYPDFVHAVVLDDDEHVVMVSQYRHGFGGHCIELPGGACDPNDETVEDTARREVSEETGYAGSSVRLLRTLSIDPAKLTNRIHAVLIEGAVPVRAPEPCATEQITVLRIPVDEALSLAMSGGIANAVHVAILLMGLSTAGKIAVRRL